MPHKCSPCPPPLNNNNNNNSVKFCTKDFSYLLPRTWHWPPPPCHSLLPYLHSVASLWLSSLSVVSAMCGLLYKRVRLRISASNVGVLCGRVPKLLLLLLLVLRLLLPVSPCCGVACLFGCLGWLLWFLVRIWPAAAFPQPLGFSLSPVPWAV